MTVFTIHTADTADPDSRQWLEKLQRGIGFVPARYGVLAEAPNALEAYDVLSTLFKSTSLTTTEQHVVLLTINFENNCGYCMPAHTGLAKLDHEQSIGGLLHNRHDVSRVGRCVHHAGARRGSYGGCAELHGNENPA